MPSGGLRQVEDEKHVLTELGKLFHVARAQRKENTQVRRAERAAPSRAASHVPKKKGSARRSRNGSSIWIVLKGGFSSRNIPSAADSAEVTRRAVQRRVLSEKLRVKALERAEAYIASAWQQVKEAGLVQDDGSTPSADGDAYLREQYEVATGMLCINPAGAYLQRLVKAHCTPTAASAATTSDLTVGGDEPFDIMDRAKWEEVLARESAIRWRYHEAPTTASQVDEAARAALDKAREKYFFSVAEPCATADGDDSRDIAPTKCIVRIRNSQRSKHTAVLSTPKAINYFRTNFGAVLRKELGNSRLPRGPVDAGVAPVKDAHAQTTNDKNSNKKQPAADNKRKHKR